MRNHFNALASLSPSASLPTIPSFSPKTILGTIRVSVWWQAKASALWAASRCLSDAADGHPLAVGAALHQSLRHSAPTHRESDRLIRLSLADTCYSKADPHTRPYAPGGVGASLHDPPFPPMRIQDTPTAVHPRSVHDDLHAVIAAWPTLAESLQAHMLQLIATGEVR
jgi:hypothetical protein